MQVDQGLWQVSRSCLTSLSPHIINLNRQKITYFHHNVPDGMNKSDKVVRILELTLCTLLAVIATTPLQSDHNSNPGLEASHDKCTRINRFF